MEKILPLPPFRTSTRVFKFFEKFEKMQPLHRWVEIPRRMQNSKIYNWRNIFLRAIVHFIEKRPNSRFAISSKNKYFKNSFFHEKSQKLDLYMLSRKQNQPK